MRRYVDVNEEIRKINEVILEKERDGKADEFTTHCFRVFANALSKAPTADVEEVRYGYWIDTTMYCGEFTCSVCKETCITNRYNYCPHCGAKMNGNNSVRKVDCSMTEDEYNKGLNDLRESMRKVVKCDADSYCSNYGAKMDKEKEI